MTSPNPLAAGWSMLRARWRRRPRPTGVGEVDHRALAPVLDALAAGGVGAIPVPAVLGYLESMSAVHPDDLTRDEALAFWIDVYNAGAMSAARRAWDEGQSSVLRLGRVFSKPFIPIGGERLSLDDVEHGKIRRFGDPRIHAALVCGSLSCPTLRFEPFEGSRLSDQLDDQMRQFLASGAAIVDRERGELSLSRVFRWYGADFVYPDRMPTLRPVGRGRVLDALVGWLDPEVVEWVRATDPRIVFQDYDWSLGCTVTRPSG